MISRVQNTFNIQDLEILSGVKAHTIRTWEKRYGLLNPARLNRGIRSYSMLELQKLLNVSLLLKHDYKISELAKLVDVELEKRAKTISLDKLKSNYYINSIIISMFSLDEELFEEVFQENISTESFSDVFRNTYIPLLNHIFFYQWCNEIFKIFTFSSKKLGTMIKFIWPRTRYSHSPTNPSAFFKE